MAVMLLILRKCALSLKYCNVVKDTFQIVLLFVLFFQFLIPVKVSVCFLPCAVIKVCYLSPPILSLSLSLYLTRFIESDHLLVILNELLRTISY